MIWHPECKNGPHSRNSPNKLQILNIYPVAPEGYAVEYKDFNDKTFFECFEGTYTNNIDEEENGYGLYNNNRFGITNK